MRTLASAVETFWVRGWFLMTDLPAGANAMELLSAEQTTSPRDGLYVFVRSDRTSLFNQFDGASASHTTPVPVGTWFCLVWRVSRATMATGVLSLSGTAVEPAIMLTDTTTDSAPPVLGLSFGIHLPGIHVGVPQPALDVWIDDVIVHSGPVTCDD
jgi:hypothetical protein